MSTDLPAVIVGVAGVLVGAAGVIAGNVIWRRVLLALGGGAVVLALTIIVLDDPEPPPPPIMTRGAFTSPPDGERESGDFLTAEGNVEGLPSTSGLLCIVKDHLPRYYPYTASVANGRWSADVGIGPASIDRQKRFTLILATATQSAVEELSRLQAANAGDDYYKNGLPELPDGIRELDKIVIVRTS